MAKKTKKKDLFDNVSISIKKKKASSSSSKKYDEVLEKSKKLKLTKNQYIEYTNIKDKFDISLKEYKSLYNDIRKANRKHNKLKELEEKGEVFINPKFSTDLTRLKSRESFEKRKEFVKLILKKDSIKVFNRQVRENLYDTLRNYFGEDAKYLIEKFEKMTDSQYYQFFKENKDLQELGYDSESYRLIDLLDQNLSKFMTALDESTIGE